MKIAIIGTGYVGLVTAACFADLGHEIIGVDIDEEKIKMIKKGKSPIYEPGLEEVIERNLKNGRLSFTTDITKALPDVCVVFSAVATPSQKDFSADTSIVMAVCEEVATHTDHDLVFVNKSTVPVGTGKDCEQRMAAILAKRGKDYRIPVVSNPEFLREGCAVGDTLHPDRIVVGINGDRWAKEIMEEVFQPFLRADKPLLFMSRESAEIVKYASNAFLANKISFINMLTELCEDSGANIRDIAAGMGLDERIGPRFLHAGIGYGGSCFPKDIKELMALSKRMGIPMPLIEATHEINERQRMRFAQKILEAAPDGSTIGIWGLSFKPGTDDMRDAPSIDIIDMLLKAGHSIQVYDPVAMDNAKKILPDTVTFCDTPLSATKDVSLLVILTEWDEFRSIDFAEIAKAMSGNALFDGRNIYDPEKIEEVGFQYHGIGMS